MYLEDLLIAITTHRDSSHVIRPRLSEWSKGFLDSISLQLQQDRALSENQAGVCLRLLRELHPHILRLNVVEDRELVRLIDLPQYRRPPYMSTSIPNEVRYLGDNLLGFRFKHAPPVVERIRDLRGQGEFTGVLHRPRFDWTYKIWIIPVLRSNIDQIEALIAEHRFRSSPRTRAYLQLARQSIAQPSSAVLMPEHDAIWLNVCDDPWLAAWATEVAGGVAL